MGCFNSNTLAICRPSQASKGSARCSVKTSVGCGGGNTNCPPGLKPRKNREKVREDLKDYVLLMLGGPVVKVELDSQQLDLAVDQALKIFEEFAPRDFFDYMTFRTTPGKSVYKMPPEVGIIRNVFYNEQPDFVFSGAQDLGGSIPIEFISATGSFGNVLGGMIDPIQPIWGNLSSWAAFKSYNNMYSKYSSALGGWEWVGGHESIKLYPTPCGCKTVIVHYLQKCKDWETVHLSMQEFVLAISMIQLGHIRGKYSSLSAGPGQSTNLDAEYYKSKGHELYDKAWENLLARHSDLLFLSMD